MELPFEFLLWGFRITLLILAFAYKNTSQLCGLPCQLEVESKLGVRKPDIRIGASY